MSPALRWTLLSLAALALILIPFAVFEEPLADWARDALSGGRSQPYVAAVLIGLLASDVLLPVPSSIVSAAAGVVLGFWLGAAVIWTGMTVGALIGYALGERFGRGVTRRWVGEGELERAERLHRRFGPFAIVLMRGVPVLAEATVVFAGVAAMRRGRFIALVAGSNAVVALAYAALGAGLVALG